MASVVPLSIAGLQDAAGRLSTSAARAMRSGSGFDMSRSYVAGETSTAVAGGPGLPLVGSVHLPGATGDTLYQPSYAEDLLSMRLAVNAYRANVKMLKVQNELDTELLAIATSHLK
jgi:hypothetical protein